MATAPEHQIDFGRLEAHQAPRKEPDGLMPQYFSEEAADVLPVRMIDKMFTLMQLTPLVPCEPTAVSPPPPPSPEPCSGKQPHACYFCQGLEASETRVILFFDRSPDSKQTHNIWHARVGHMRLLPLEVYDSGRHPEVSMCKTGSGTDHRRNMRFELTLSPHHTDSWKPKLGPGFLFCRKLSEFDRKWRFCGRLGGLAA